MDIRADARTIALALSLFLALGLPQAAAQLQTLEDVRKMTDRMMVAYDAHDYRQARSLARSILIQANPLLKDLDTDEKRTLYVKAYYFFSLSGVKDINKAETLFGRTRESYTRHSRTAF